MSARLILDESTQEGRLLQAFEPALNIGCTLCLATKRAGMSCAGSHGILEVLVGRRLVERILVQGRRTRPQLIRITGAGREALARGHQVWPEVLDGT